MIVELSILEIDPVEREKMAAQPRPPYPPWVRPMPEGCSEVTNYLVEFTEVPLPAG